MSVPEMLIEVPKASWGKCRMKQNGKLRNEGCRKSKRGAVGRYESVNDGADLIVSTSDSDVRSIAEAKRG